LNTPTLRVLRVSVIVALLMGVSAIANSQQPAKGGYLFTTFKNGAEPGSEQIYFGLSQDGLHWDALNNGNAVLVSDIGEKGVRDSYLLRSHDGKKFFLIATDLAINLNPDWKRARTAGSKSIVIWESDDLVKWSAPRMVKVAPDDAGCTWVPEAIYDDQTGDYMVYWASTTQGDNYTKQRIWSAHTKDFKKFSKPVIYIEKSASVIDTDIIREKDKYYRFSSDARNKTITMEVADRLAGPWTDVPGYSLADMHGSEGPAAFRLPSPDGSRKEGDWCLMLDFVSKGEGYKAFTTTDLASGAFVPDNEIKFPFAIRHGSVLSLSASEYKRVKFAYGAGERRTPN